MKNRKAVESQTDEDFISMVQLLVRYFLKCGLSHDLVIMAVGRLDLNSMAGWLDQVKSIVKYVKSSHKTAK